MAEAKGRGEAAAEAQNAAETMMRASQDAARETGARLSEQAQQGIRQTNAASAAGADAALRTGTSLAEGVQEITNAWAQYAGEVMRQTSEASRALIGCRSLTEMIEVQTRLLRGNMQAFLNQSTTLTEIAGRMATRPFDALKQASEVRPPR
jgi:phasin family protein